MNDEPAASSDLDRFLRTPLPMSLGPADPAVTEKIVVAARQQHVLIESLWQLFLAPRPPLDLLVLVRDFAKRHLASKTSPLSADDARLIYLAAIASAFVGSNERITSLGDKDMLQQFHWARKLKQTPAELRDLFARAERNWTAPGAEGTPP